MCGGIASRLPFLAPMARLTLAAALLLAAPTVLAQAVTRPAVTVTAGILRSSDFYNEQGDTTDDFAKTRSFSASLGAEAPVWRRAGQTVSAGATLTLASYSLVLNSPDGPDVDPLDGRLRPQRLDVFGRIGNTWASALLGASLNLGRDPNDFDIEFDPEASPDNAPPYYFNSDGQHAITAQLRGAYPAGRVRLTGQIDAALTFTNRVTVPVFDFNSPDTPSSSDTDIDVDNGNPVSMHLGADVLVGPVTVGLAGFYAYRSEGSVEYVDGAPAGFPAIQPNQLGYRSALGLIPSVAFRTPDGRVTVRAEGAFSDFYAMEGTPVGLTLSGEFGPVARPALTLSASIGL